MNALLSTTYFGPIQWYQKLYRADETWIESCESFQKQTYRNRCLIATTNGVQALTVPVERSNLKSQISNLKSQTSARPKDACYQRDARNLKPQIIRDLRISDHGNWRHLHWNALQSAYGDSPFFEYYQDDIRPFFERRWEFLLDFNEAIRQSICSLIDICPQVRLTEAFTLTSTADYQDYRDAINPKHPAPDPDFVPRRYYQVYEAKHGFLPNLSILDLLFNMGPESIFYL